MLQSLAALAPMLGQGVTSLQSAQAASPVVRDIVTSLQGASGTASSSSSVVANGLKALLTAANAGPTLPGGIANPLTPQVMLDLYRGANILAEGCTLVGTPSALTSMALSSIPALKTMTPGLCEFVQKARGELQTFLRGKNVDLTAANADADKVKNAVAQLLSGGGVGGGTGGLLGGLLPGAAGAVGAAGTVPLLTSGDPFRNVTVASTTYTVTPFGTFSNTDTTRTYIVAPAPGGAPFAALIPQSSSATSDAVIADLARQGIIVTAPPGANVSTALDGANLRVNVTLPPQTAAGQTGIGAQTPSATAEPWPWWYYALIVAGALVLVVAIFFIARAIAANKQKQQPTYDILAKSHEASVETGVTAPLR